MGAIIFIHLADIIYRFQYGEQNLADRTLSGIIFAGEHSKTTKFYISTLNFEDIL